MNAPIRPLLLALPLLVLLPLAAAQAQAPAEPLPADAAAAPAASAGDRIERITHEDSLSRINELRVGGQTQSIEVQPKNGAPAYQITTEPGVAPSVRDVAGQRTGTSGRSSWRILSF
ncbi:MAG: hypothetical protein MUF76_07385 [Hydrogenophaga sp.]|jgi:hypothetical protein|nr:hypothetical protein [Hydrogenophaga sp.]